MHWATFRYIQSSKSNQYTHLFMYSLIVLNGGLLLVDHIHFQYNGLLLGLLILCFDLANKRSYKALALVYSILVLMKHLFAPLAPIFAIFLLNNHCFKLQPISTIKSLINFSQLVAIAIFALLGAFLPFILLSHSSSAGEECDKLLCHDSLILHAGNGVLDQIAQIFSRLFPFGRGLVHAYWAPNVWAIYCFLDKVAATAAKKISALSFLLRADVATVVSVQEIANISGANYRRQVLEGIFFIFFFYS